MDDDIKRKWVRALRSGEYQQCSDALAKDGGFCCLGVLHAVVTGTPPHLEAWGIKMSRPQEIDLTEDEMAILENMNDGNTSQGQHTFPEIADYIEANL